jgi:hypothetical protein
LKGRGDKVSFYRFLSPDFGPCFEGKGDKTFTKQVLSPKFERIKVIREETSFFYHLFLLEKG